MSPTTCASCQKLGSGKCPDHDIRRQGTKHQKKVDKVPTLLVSIDDPLGPIRYKIQEKVDDFTPEPNELLVVALLLSGQMIDNSLTLCKQVIANPIEYLPIANQSIDNWFNEYYSVEIEPHLLTMPNCNCSICGSKTVIAILYAKNMTVVIKS
ncbi:hypothetical protein BC833DRAFT_564298 [Globomyces pollinis-pini]|nr:hypothetical protein BC833DRAFT_564298 [Globomyces pollinis-pini]